MYLRRPSQLAFLAARNLLIPALHIDSIILSRSVTERSLCAKRHGVQSRKGERAYMNKRAVDVDFRAPGCTLFPVSDIDIARRKGDPSRPRRGGRKLGRELGDEDTRGGGGGIRALFAVVIAFVSNLAAVSRSLDGPREGGISVGRRFPHARSARRVAFARAATSSLVWTSWGSLISLAKGATRAQRPARVSPQLRASG